MKFRGQTKKLPIFSLVDSGTARPAGCGQGHLGGALAPPDPPVTTCKLHSLKHLTHSQPARASRPRQPSMPVPASLDRGFYVIYLLAAPRCPC